MPRLRKRGIILYVEEVLEKGWFRSQVRAQADFLSDDKSPGYFRAMRFTSAFAGRVVVKHSAIRVMEDVPVFLVCQGRDWEIGDAIPFDKIIYQFEP